jgi:excisionase family DNA binding protein
MTTARAAARSDEPRWASLNEAATYMHVSRNTLRNWIAWELLPAKRVGPRLIQVDLNDLDRLRTSIPVAAAVLADGQDG